MYMNITHKHNFNLNEILPESNINRNKYHDKNFKNVSNTHNAAYFCNLEKQNKYNDYIFNRNVNCNKISERDLLYVERPKIKDCKNINRHNKNKIPDLEHPILGDCCKKSECISDKSNPLDYFSSIDVESYVLNIDRKLNNCRSIEYKRGDVNCHKCDELCCHNIEKNIGLPEVTYTNPNKCIKLQKPNKCRQNKNLNRPRPFDTLYDYSDKNYGINCQPVWNIRSKRKYLDPSNCSKDRYFVEEQECPHPCLGNYPDMSDLLKENRNVEFDFCPNIDERNNNLLFNN